MAVLPRAGAGVALDARGDVAEGAGASITSFAGPLARVAMSSPRDDAAIVAPETPRSRPEPTDVVVSDPDGFPRFAHHGGAHARALEATTAGAADALDLLLTFDDGPELATTPLVLDELRRRGLRAVFFVSGHRLLGDGPEVDARRQLVRRMAAEGHIVGSHARDHIRLCGRHVDQAREIDDTTAIIEALTGVRPTLFRAPYGRSCPALEDALRARGYQHVGWSIDPQDWRADRGGRGPVDRAATSRIERARGRGILLMHDTRSAGIVALPRILDWIEARNRAVALDRAGRSFDGDVNDAGAPALGAAANPRIVVLTPESLLPSAPAPDPGVTSVLTSIASSLSVVAAALPRFARVR